MAKLTAQRQIRGRVAEQVGVKVRKVPTRPTYTKTSTPTKQELIQKEIQKVDAEIRNYQNDIAGYVAKQEALQGGNRAEWNELDNQIGFARRQIKNLVQGKQYIRQGAGFADVTRFAVAKSGAEIENIEARKEWEKKQAELQKQREGQIEVGGQGYSVAPGLQNQFMTPLSELPTNGVSTKEQLIAKYFTPKPRTAGEWEVQPVPTKTEQWKQQVSQKGYLTGTLDFARGKFQSTHDYWQQSAGYYGGLKETEMVGGALRIAPYFAPGGGYLLMGEGVEGLTSPEGKETISYRKEALKEKGFGDFTSTTLSVTPEVLEIGLGYASSPFFTKTTDYFKTFGREKIDINKLIPAEVQSGAKSFPTADPKKHLKMFQEQGYGYHATPDPWGELVTGAGSSELKGTYFSTKVSPYFLRSGATEGSKLDVLDIMYGDVIYGSTKPGVMQVFPKQFRAGEYIKIPGAKPKPHGFEWTSEFKLGTAEVPGMKTEIEAILRPGTELTKTSGSKYFLWKGRVIPIDTFETAGKVGEKVNIFARTPRTLSSYSGSYGGAGSGYFTGTRSTYSIFGGLSSSIFKPSSSFKSSYGGSFKSSDSSVFKPSSSKTSGYKPSEYKPSSYKPSGYDYGGYSFPRLSSSYGGSSYYKKVPTGYKPGSPEPKKPIGLKLPSFSLREERKEQSYIPQVMHKGKWKTVGKRMDRNSALSRASKGADLSTSRRMRILPSNKKPQVTGVGGWGMRRYKFRPHRIQRGQKIKLPNSYIEKTSYAMDQPSEKAQFNIARISKNMGWMQPTPKKKVKGKKRRKSQWLF